MATEEYPIHPTFDALIQAFKKFSQISFPRGIPQPALAWKDLIQGLTYYESLVVQRAQEYMSAKKITLPELKPMPAFNQAITAFKIRSAEDSDYMQKYVEYKNQIEAISHLLEDCVDQLGNPYSTVTINS
jgi:hypothetical protein